MRRTRELSVSGSRDEPASAAQVVRLYQRNPGLRAHLARRPIIDRKYRVPYLAGSSSDGMVVYIDSQIPERFAQSNIEPDEYYARHEMPEWWLMTQLGMAYEQAHKLACGIERYTMQLAGIDDARIEQYEAESAALMTDEHAGLPP